MWKWLSFLLLLSGCATHVQRYEIVQSSNPQLNQSHQLGQVINAKQQCLTFSAGQTVNLQTCTGSPAQQWVFEPQTAILRNPISGLCLDVATDTVTSGSFLAGKPCRNLPSQQWFFDRQNLYNSFGWCVDEVKEPSQTVAYLAACSTRPAQHFVFSQLNQPITPYFTPQPQLQTTTVLYERPYYYSPFFYTYPFFYWSFYYSYPYRPYPHHHKPPHSYLPPHQPDHRPAPKPPVAPVDKNQNGRYDRGDFNRNDSLKGRVHKFR